MPPKALRLADALATIMTRDDEERLGFSFRALVFREIHQLVDWSADDRLTIHPRARIEQALPLLQRLTGGAAGVRSMPATATLWLVVGERRTASFCSHADRIGPSPCRARSLRWRPASMCSG